MEGKERSGKEGEGKVKGRESERTWSGGRDLAYPKILTWRPGYPSL